jgi:3-oxoacyl-[acyl-carrier-protein] synthase-3
VERREHYLVQDGRVVFKAATTGMVETTRELLDRNGLSTDALQWLVPHQANKRIIDAVGAGLGIDSERVMCNIDRYGNTSSATIPVCLSEWVEKNKLQVGDHMVLTSFGAGFISASVYLRWAIPARMPLEDVEECFTYANCSD